MKLSKIKSKSAIFNGGKKGKHRNEKEKIKKLQDIFSNKLKEAVIDILDLPFLFFVKL